MQNAVRKDNITGHDWAAISAHPRFVELHNKKKRFLVGWWLFSAVFYFMLPVGAAYFGSVYATRLFGVVNLGIVLSFSEFVVAWAVAFHYANVANKEFDRLTSQLLAELDAEGK